MQRGGGGRESDPLDEFREIDRATGFAARVFCLLLSPNPSLPPPSFSCCVVTRSSSRPAPRNGASFFVFSRRGRHTLSGLLFATVSSVSAFRCCSQTSNRPRLGSRKPEKLTGPRETTGISGEISNLTHTVPRPDLFRADLFHSEPDLFHSEAI